MQGFINFLILLFIVTLCISSIFAISPKNLTVSGPRGKILAMFPDNEETNSLEARAGNKTTKILTGPLRPTTSTTTPFNPYFMHPQSPGFLGYGDSMAQGSVQQPNLQPHSPPSTSNNYNNNQVKDDSSGVPEIYVQLIGAIEKLVGRMDKLDTRLRTVENIVYHMTNKKEEAPEQGSCPKNFRKVEGIRGKCYQISSYLKNPMVYDWKSSENECTRVGGRLVEMINYDDFVRISQFLIKYNSASNSGSSDYWVGGINPGLIWIWADSGTPIEMNKRFWNENDNGSTVPGCLKLSFSHRLQTYFFKHSPCGISHNHICEIMDNTVSRALAHFEEHLWNDSV